MKWVCLLLFGSVGLAAFVAGVAWGFKRYSLWRVGVKTTGAIVDFNESTSTDNSGTRPVRSRSYFPVVEFIVNDHKHRFQASTGSSNPEYEKGTPVPVLYDPQDPTQAQVATFEQFWLGPLGVGLFGFLFLAGGIGGFFLIADSDRTFGPAFETEMAKVDLVDGKRGIPLAAVVASVRPGPVSGANATYVVVCRGGAPGGVPRDFESAPLSFDPGAGVIGKPVNVYVDPNNAARFYVDTKSIFSVESDAH